MTGLLRRIRGIIKTGLTWAVGWGAGLGLLQIVVSIGAGYPLTLLGSIVGGAMSGFIAGASFATILSITERHRTLDQLSLKRVALWGSIGGAGLFLLVVPQMLSAGMPLGMLITAYLGPTLIAGLLGAGSAAGSVALARRGDESLIEGAHDVALLERE